VLASVSASSSRRGPDTPSRNPRARRRRDLGLQRETPLPGSSSASSTSTRPPSTTGWSGRASAARGPAEQLPLPHGQPGLLRGGPGPLPVARAGRRARRALRFLRPERVVLSWFPRAARARRPRGEAMTRTSRLLAWRASSPLSRRRMAGTDRSARPPRAARPLRLPAISTTPCGTGFPCASHPARVPVVEVILVIRAARVPTARPPGLASMVSTWRTRARGTGCPPDRGRRRLPRRDLSTGASWSVPDPPPLPVSRLGRRSPDGRRGTAAAFAGGPRAAASRGAHEHPPGTRSATPDRRPGARPGRLRQGPPLRPAQTATRARWRRSRRATSSASTPTTTTGERRLVVAETWMRQPSCRSWSGASVLAEGHGASPALPRRASCASAASCWWTDRARAVRAAPRRVGPRATRRTRSRSR